MEKEKINRKLLSFREVGTSRQDFKALDSPKWGQQLEVFMKAAVENKIEWKKFLRAKTHPQGIMLEWI